ncbi:MAG: thioredoxin-disulfide reductase [Desulfohalobiaceae bacterium]|nr:thioredoxin-disulfide reductase [Desulfohalobiaceae bacterium]
MQTYDVLVIGGGPAGMTAALYALRAGASLAWVEKFAPGGQVLNTEWIENYMGYPQGVQGFELVDQMAKHLEGFSYDKYMDEVQSLEPEYGKNVVRMAKSAVQAKSVIICSGAEYKKLGVSGEDELIGRGVSYCALCDGQFFRDQDIACIGGGNTALEESLYLARLGRKVYLIHRRDAFRGDKIYGDKVIAEPNIEILYDTVVTRILGEKEVSGLDLRNVKTDESSQLDVQGVFVFVGLDPIVSFVPPEMERDEAGFVLTDTEMRTNLSGIFAAGDVRSKNCRQITTAVGDGATAGYGAFLFSEMVDNE